MGSGKSRGLPAADRQHPRQAHETAAGRMFARLLRCLAILDALPHHVKED
jgi:hypothetical protein